MNSWLLKSIGRAPPEPARSIRGYARLRPFIDRILIGRVYDPTTTIVGPEALRMAESNRALRSCCKAIS